MKLSIIIPMLNEAASIRQTLLALQGLRRDGHEVVVVDGGSTDASPALAHPLADLVLHAPPGRAQQMNEGAQHARGNTLLFLHADTRLPQDAPRLIAEGMKKRGKSWGRFDLRLSGSHPLLRLVGFMINLRSRLSGIAGGDQGIFVTKFLFCIAGGFPEIGLMEDIALCRRLKQRCGAPLCLRDQVTTSSRRWEQNGVLRTILLMWGLRLAYALGADPERLARIYAGQKMR